MNGAQRLRLDNLHVATAGDASRRLVDGVGFELVRGRVTALLGRSGSGKSLTCAAALDVLPPGVVRLAGGARLDGVEVPLAALRGRHVATIVQNPRTAFNPVMTLRAHARETLAAAGADPDDEDRIAAAFTDVGLADTAHVLAQHPFRLSGGMLQRAMLALALLTGAPFLFADEPTTDLDLLAQKRVLDLIARVAAERGLGVLLVTHDLAVVARLAHEVLLMEAGVVVERQDVPAFFGRPLHPLARSLVSTHFALYAGDAAAAGKPGAPARGAGPPLLAARGLALAYRGKPVLRGVDLAIGEGERVALLGASGSGKSTLARLLLGLERPDAGSVVYRGAPLASLRGEALRGFRAAVQAVFQDAPSAVDPRQEVGRVVEAPLRHLTALGRGARPARVAELLASVRLAPAHAGRAPGEMSGGQLQRVCLARALAPAPRLVILDEAVSNLDLALQLDILDLLAGHARAHGTAFLFITHDLRLARRFCTRALLLDGGRVVEEMALDAGARLCHPAGRALEEAILPPWPAGPLRNGLRPHHDEV